MEYKKFNQAYLDQIVDLLNICFSNKNITVNSFLWKHYSAFFNNKSIGMVAIDKNRVCAFTCFTPIFIGNNKNIYKNFYSCAAQATHPKYRRRGIISYLTQTIEKQLGNSAEYIGFSNDDGIKIDKFSKKIGYKILGQMATRYILSLPYKTNFKITQVEKIFTENLTSSNYFGILKNIDYLKWRYLTNPKHKYEYFEVKNKNIVKGYIICKNNKIKYDIFDLLLNSDDAKEFKLIIKSFANFSFSKGKIIVSYSYLPNNLRAKSFPFFSLSKNIPIYLTIKTTKNNLLNINNWIIQGGDIQ